MNYRKRKRISLITLAVAFLPIVVLLVSIGITLASRPKNQPQTNAFWSKHIGLFFIVGLSSMFVGLAFIWLWEFQSRISRKAKMQELARQLGFSYTRQMPLPQELKGSPLFDEFGYVYRNISNVLRGVVEGLEVSIFDYRHPEYLSSGGGTHAGSIWTFIDTLILIRSGNNNLRLFTFDKGLEVERIKRELDSALEKYRQTSIEHVQQRS